MKASFLVTIFFGAIAALIYFFAIEPTEAKLDRVRREKAELEDRNWLMSKNIAGADQVKARLTDCENRLDPFKSAMLVPLLESTAMRAKSIVDTFAIEAGLTDTEYESLPPIALPVPKRIPVQLHRRCPIRITCRGSYQAAVSFILRIEKELPLVILQSFTIISQPIPDEQKIEFILEWPAKGATTK